MNIPRLFLLSLLVLFVGCGGTTTPESNKRFYYTDEGDRIYLLHDREHPDACVLVLYYGDVLTSQPWPCGSSR